MHATIFQKFEEICSSRKAGGSVLEIGAVPADNTLLCLPCLSAATERIGLNLDGPHSWRGFEILQGNANDMACFPDQRFDTVLCNSMLEHDRQFWKTLVEIRRVAKPGALIVLGVPGYTDFDLLAHLHDLTRIPLLGRFLRRRFQGLASATLTLPIHNYPGDYWRFSPQAMEQVLLEGMDAVEVCSLMIPARIIGAAVKR
ncbi:MAG: methyltransferase domain-containing protein [Planctomycetes bacterium]|nr:methyltransferase domain-containing protein [Planctomycetota bacterium]